MEARCAVPGGRGTGAYHKSVIASRDKKLILLKGLHAAGGMELAKSVV